MEIVVIGARHVDHLEVAIEAEIEPTLQIVLPMGIASTDNAITVEAIT